MLCYAKAIFTKKPSTQVIPWPEVRWPPGQLLTSLENLWHWFVCITSPFVSGWVVVNVDKTAEPGWISDVRALGDKPAGFVTSVSTSAHTSQIPHENFLWWTLLVITILCFFKAITLDWLLLWNCQECVLQMGHFK